MIKKRRRRVETKRGTIQIRCTEEEKALVHEACDKRGESMSLLFMPLILEAAKKIVEE